MACVAAMVFAACGGTGESGTSPPGGNPDAGIPSPGKDAAPLPGPDAGIGLGATPYSGGTHFRVWAPNATSVAVEGDWNQFSATADPMTMGTDGDWSADIPAASVGQQYAYRIVNGTSKATRADPRAYQMTNAAGRSIIYDQNAYAWKSGTFAEPDLSAMVIYEMHIGTFNVAPADAGTTPGTWQSAIAKLDTLAALGVDMVEVMPPAEFEGDFSWGYDPSYPMAPSSAYGTPDDAKAFIDAAHADGIGVIIDVVHNHYGPDDLSMWCFDLDCLGAGGIYFYTDGNAQTAWGPRPDYGRQEIRDYITDSTRLWLDTYRADGLRWDSTSNIRANNGAAIPDGLTLLQQLNDLVDATAPGKIMIAEDMQNDSSITAATSGGGAGFDSQWDPGFCNPVDDAIIASQDTDRDMNSVASAISGNGAGWQRVIFTESHDQVANGRSRVPEMITPGDPGSIYARKRSTLGAALALTSPGIPMLFMGQEFLTGSYFQDNVPLELDAPHDLPRHLADLHRSARPPPHLQ